MAIKLNIKSVKPFQEISFKLPDIVKPITIGVRSFNNEELQQVRITYGNLLVNDRQAMLKAQLDKLVAEGDRTTEEFYVDQRKLMDELQKIAAQQDMDIINFFKSQITHVKDIAMQYIETNDETGASRTVDVNVADTRIVAPIESLWLGEEDCLAVLLDVLFSFPNLGDSLITALTNAVFQIKPGKVKN